LSNPGPVVVRQPTGSGTDLYFAGSPVLELFPLVPITANVSIGVGALSYAGQFNITVVADGELCPT
jgi:diacylglycerol O-acyltransferase / wax synthase